MTLTSAITVLTLVSVALGLLKRRFYLFSKVLLNLLMVFFALDGVLFAFNESIFLDQFKNPKIIFLIFVESFFYIQLSRNKKKAVSILPASALPLLCLLLLSFLDMNLNDKNAFYLFSVALLIQPLWVTGTLGPSYYFKKLVVNILVFVLGLITLLVYNGSFNFFVILFLYWFSLDLIPLGLDKDSSQDDTYPIANRVLIFSLLVTQAPLNIPVESVLWIVVAIGLGASSCIIVSKCALRSWFIFKRALESLFLFFGILIFGKLTQEVSAAILSVSLVSMIAHSVINDSSKKRLNVVFVVISFLFCCGFLVGAPSFIIEAGFRKSLLDGVGDNVLLYALPIWSLNLVFWTKLFGIKPQNESKIDHLQAVFFLSLIMIGVLITL